MREEKECTEGQILELPPKRLQKQKIYIPYTPIILGKTSEIWRDHSAILEGLKSLSVVLVQSFASPQPSPTPLTSPFPLSKRANAEGEEIRRYIPPLPPLTTTTTTPTDGDIMKRYTSDGGAGGGRGEGEEDNRIMQLMQSLSPPPSLSFRGCLYYYVVA